MSKIIDENDEELDSAHKYITIQKMYRPGDSTKILLMIILACACGFFSGYLAQKNLVISIILIICAWVSCGYLLALSYTIMEKNGWIK